ncbi:FABP family protein [Bradyrhizobium guangdongense]|uniref:FABP family protein n=2 Tax=Bradyrhizobium guangdongense TaxID=1325090 RepID=A0AA87W1H8_9BRAD|nr:FABP family protein [Bradyrhizobium guangdongense]
MLPYANAAAQQCEVCMLPLPADIFTEPEDVSPDSLANLGPLRRLAGTWQADKGIDINPKADGPERRTFIERIRMDPIDPQANGPQLLYGLRYHVHINTPEEDITFHDQVGYWLWEPATGLVMQTLAIPRGQVLLASGKAAPEDRKISVTAKRGDTAYGICSTDFLEQAFRTDSYRCDITLNDDSSWSYLIQTELFVRGAPFNHHDSNTLLLVAPPKLNPLAAIVNERAKGNRPA